MIPQICGENQMFNEIKRRMSQGRDKRPSILPKQDPTIGILGPDYVINDVIPTPAEIGVRRGDTLGSAIDAVKGMAYYIDTIGFGESSTKMSKGLSQPVQKFGINYFMPTGARCSNGADMWMFVETIPKGDALGKNAQRAMKQLGMPELRGLAPGIIEDAKSALDPRPMMSAVFGSGYPKCELVEKQVGDPRGRIQGPDGKPWVYDKKSVTIRNGIPYQQKWVQATDKAGKTINLTREQYVADRKTQNKDGSPVEKEKERAPRKKEKERAPRKKEKFEDMNKLNTISLAVAASLFAIAYSIQNKQ
jgi:hypothetical protein